SAALERARERGLVAGALAPGDLLRFPQAITVTEARDSFDPGVFPDVEGALGDALDELDRMRAQEGRHLRTELDTRRAQLGGLFDQAAGAAAAGSDVLRGRL